MDSQKDTGNKNLSLFNIIHFCFLSVHQQGQSQHGR
jgi:hypothetical protein